MSNWFHHDPATGRHGPFSTEGLLDRYRQRLIQADTLVWREGLREWLTLERAMADLDTVLGPQDSSMPPPLPARAQAPAMAPQVSDRFHPGMRTAAPQKRGLSGCLIALIIVAVLSVPMIAILAAIALPAYRDYTVKAKTAQAIAESRPLQEAMIDYVGRHHACPAQGEPGFDDLQRYASPVIESVQLGVASDGSCVYGLVLPFSRNADRPAMAVMAMRGSNDRKTFEFDCQASTLPRHQQPGTCQGLPEDPR